MTVRREIAQSPRETCARSREGRKHSWTVCWPTWRRTCLDAVGAETFM